MLNEMKSESLPPLVKRIEGDLKAKILSGKLSPGERLPSMRKISEQLQVSLGIAKQAVNTLTNQGYVRAERGRGVFVEHPWVYRRNIALVLPNLDSEQMSDILRGAKLGMDNGSARMIVQAADYDFNEEADLIQGLNPSFVSGAIVYPAPLKSEIEKLRQIRRRGVPFVLVNTAFETLEANSFTTDTFAIGRLTFEHLVSRGHRKIGVIGNTANSLSSRERLEGANEVLVEVGLHWRDLPKVMDMVSQDRSQPWAEGQKAAEILLKDHADITAIVGMNENITAGVLRALQLRGITPGEDISVMSMSDMRMLDAWIPPITAIRQPFEEMGTRAAHCLQRLLAGEEFPPAWTRLAPKLIDRGSVKDIR
ncbi:MAG: GntR family transcriptional regulator [Phycisphaerae bacterium]|nr:GntR family transcriptional regulator [Phycisphaerae bacterium]